MAISLIQKRMPWTRLFFIFNRQPNCQIAPYPSERAQCQASGPPLRSPKPGTLGRDIASFGFKLRFQSTDACENRTPAYIDDVSVSHERDSQSVLHFGCGCSEGVPAA